MIVIICDDHCGVIANKHIFVLFFLVSSPFLSRLVHLSVQTAQKKTTDIYLVRGLIEAERRFIHSSPYKRPTLG